MSTYINKPGPNAPIEQRILFGRLESFFRKASNFEVRWRQSFWGDSASPAVPAPKLERDFNRKEIRQAEESRWITKKRYQTNPRAPHFTAYVFVAKVLPQLSRKKRYAFWIKTHKGFLIPLLALLIAGLTLLPWKKAFGMGNRAPQMQTLKGDIPLSVRVGHFDDPTISVRCYYILKDSNSSISCVKTSYTTNPDLAPIPLTPGRQGPSPDPSPSRPPRPRHRVPDPNRDELPCASESSRHLRSR